MQKKNGHPDGGTPVLEPPTVDDPGTSPFDTAWALAWRAAQNCGLQAVELNSSVLPWQSGWDGDPNTWFYYGENQDCSDRLAMEQNLVCVADALGALSDAVGTTVWAVAPQGLSYGGTFTYNASGDAGLLTGNDVPVAELLEEWDIPPQADADRFILRDLAIHILALIPTVDAYTDLQFPSPIPRAASCAEAFAWASDKSHVLSCTENADWAYALFGVSVTPNQAVFPLLPPSSAPICDASGNSYNANSIALSALQLEAQTLRAGSRLLHDLIRRDVYSDLAASARAGAQSNDPLAGNQAAWGVNLSPGAEPYGTISHAARVLMGRWEVGNKADSTFPPGINDPQCLGVSELSIMTGAPSGKTAPAQDPPFGPDLDARYDDMPIRTPGEQTAVQLVEQSGLIVPPCAVPGGSGNTTSSGSERGSQDVALRAALTAELTGQTKSTGLFTTILAGVQDAELEFAFQRAIRTWRLLTNQPDPACHGSYDRFGIAGLKAAKPATGVAMSLDAGVIVGGLSRARMATDTIARASGMLEVSQCADAMYTSEPTGGGARILPASTSGWTAWGLDDGATIELGDSTAPPQLSLPTVTFQDAFHIGQAFERRLAILDHQAKLIPGKAGEDPIAGADPVARGAIAELRSWAGSVMVHAWPTSSSELSVLVEGLSASDIAVDALTAAAVQKAYGFVYGPPWVAECAAGVRPDCPSSFATDYLLPVTSAAAVTASSAPVSLTTLTNSGVLNSSFSLSVSLKGAHAPPLSATLEQSDARLYMVLLRDGRSPLGHGRVLGVLPVAGAEVPPVCTRENGVTFCTQAQFVGSVVNFVDAPMQRELLHDALDLGKWVGASPPSLGDASLGTSSGYCVDGVPRDIFVPLDNELISGTQTYEDSWQTYLSLAQQAAATADTLGQQLIADDLQISETEQSAAVTFANLCGDFGNLSGATVAPTGIVTPAAGDQTAAACLSTQTVDVSYLGSTVPNLTCNNGSSPTECFQKNILQCDVAGTQSPLCAKPLLTFAALNLVTPPAASTPVAQSNAQCSTLENALGTLPTGLDGQGYYNAIQGAFSPSQIAALASSLQMTVDPFNRWAVTTGGETLMSSTDTKYWPACLGVTGGCTKLGNAGNSAAKMLNTAFRWCPNITSEKDLLDALLGCDGSVDVGLAEAQAEELNVLKWRVMQGVWMTGVSAGEVPAGMFAMSLPVALEATPASTTPVPYFTAFDGVWARVPGAPIPVPGSMSMETLNKWKASHNSNAFISAFGTAYDVESSFGAFTARAASELPPWYVSMYQSAVGGLGLATTLKNTATEWENPAIVFSRCTYAAFAAGSSAESCIQSETKKGVTSSQLAMSDVLAAGSTSLDRITCALPFGESAVGATPVSPQSGKPLWQLVATAKGAIAGEFADDGFGTGDASWLVGQSCGMNAVFDPDVVFSCPLWGDIDPNGPQTWADPPVTVPMTSKTSASSFAQTGAPYSSWPFSSPPGERAVGFFGVSPPNGTCGAVRLLAQPAAIACAALGVTTVRPSPTSEPPTHITGVAEMGELSAWQLMAEQSLSAGLSWYYVTGLPQNVVTAIQNKTVGVGAAAGAMGSTLLKMEQDVQAIPAGWAQIAGNLGTIQAAVAGAQLAIEAAGENQTSQDLQLAFQSVSVQGQMTQATFSAVQQSLAAAAQAASAAGEVLSIGTQGAISVAETAVAIAAGLAAVDTGNQELSNVQQQVQAVAASEQTATLQAVNALTSTTIPAWTQIQTSVANVRGAVAALQEDVTQLQLTQGQADYQLAVGTGQDFVNIAGQEVPIPVDTVLRRQASATEQRYQIALTNAKALAYMARRAIEQRIGVPLDALTQSVGPLDAPASWADDICSLQGVNYASLSSAVPANQDGGGIDGGVDQAAISQFADAWVGDYVAKLQSFVTYYNVQYPSHQGDDTAVLSLRYDLLAGSGQCQAPGANLLLNSDGLDSAAEGGAWQTGTCASWAGKCLTVFNGGALAAPAMGPDGTGGMDSSGSSQRSASGVSWLVDIAETGTGGFDAGPTVPANTVSQAVTLQPGSYVLSWWDQARTAEGSVLTSGKAIPYVVEILDPSGHSVANIEPTPFKPKTGASGSGLWSARNTLAFTVENPATYTVAFAASDVSTPGTGSVAVADVQLEVSASGKPSAYVPTSSTTSVAVYDCPLSDAQLRGSFLHSCDAAGTCWYDLTAPLVIDTGALNAGSSSLGQKLAAGNYNYRNIDVAINLVGTSVHTCVNDQTPNCYGSGYIQYDLNHDATNAGIVGYDGNTRFFDFGIGSINHGKALAAERYLTMPLASADQQLVTQPGIQHIELSGRPLDGAYSLRIWDSPDLNWSALQDIQIIFDYEYWSSIVTSSDNLQGRNHRRPAHVRQVSPGRPGARR